jgi:hypothetical protein
MDKQIRAMGEKGQAYIAKILGAENTRSLNGRWHPVDGLLNRRDAIEVKTRVRPDARPRVNMGVDNKPRKIAWARANHRRMSTVAVDSTTQPWTIYWQRGFAAYHYKSMIQVTPKQLRAIYAKRWN